MLVSVFMVAWVGSRLAERSINVIAPTNNNEDIDSQIKAKISAFKAKSDKEDKLRTDMLLKIDSTADDAERCAAHLSSSECYLEGMNLAPGETPAPTPAKNAFSKTLGVNLRHIEVLVRIAPVLGRVIPTYASLVCRIPAASNA
jgi:hypothetical protein